MSGQCRDGHQPQRVPLNDWDDLTSCSRCGHWIQVHHNVRGPNPNFERRRR